MSNSPFSELPNTNPYASPAPQTDGRQKNWAGKAGPKAFWGLNRTRNSTGPAGRAPGGWGAEESGSRTEPGHEATVRLSRRTVTRRCPKLGLFVCGFNDFVIAFLAFGRAV